MNYNKAQKIVFDSICRGGRCGRFMVDDKNVFVTPDGIRGFVFPAASVCFNVEKIREMEKVPILETIKEENELKLTDDFRINERERTMMRRLKGGKKNSVFVNVKYLECFQNPRFYQDANPRGIIVVTESMSSKETNIPVGIIMPVRVSAVGDGYYCD